jgi:hypothetical protein
MLAAAAAPVPTRWAPEWARDTAIAHIRSRGHNVYLVADRQDMADFKARFANSQVAAEIDRGVPVVLSGTRIFAVGGSSPPPAPRSG